MRKKYIFPTIAVFMIMVMVEIPVKANTNNIIENIDGSISIETGQLTLSELFSYLHENRNIQVFVIEEIDLKSAINVDLKDKSIDEILKIVLKNHSYAIVYNNSKLKGPEDGAHSAVSILSNNTESIKLPTLRNIEVDKSVGGNNTFLVEDLGKTQNIATIFSGSGEILSQISVKSSKKPSTTSPHRPVDYYNPGNIKQRNNAISKKEGIQNQIEALNKRIDSGISDQEYEKWVSIRGKNYVTHDRERLANLQKQLDNF
jgi:hypothetical protein